MSVIGKSIPRLDGIAKVTGSAKYVDDLFLPNMLIAKILHSTICHGLVKKIDISNALKIQGVAKIFTYDDVPLNTFSTAGHPYSLDEKMRDIADKQLLTQYVRYFGDEIAVVVATNELSAQKALKLIKVEYEEYPPLLSLEDILNKTKYELHNNPHNILGHHSYHIGDVDKTLLASHDFLEATYQTSIVQHCAMENHSTIALMDAMGRIIIYSSTQIPHICRRIVGEALNLPWGKIRVIKPYIGGGFGSKQDVILEPLAAFLALSLNGRPVKLAYEREETFINTRTRHAIKINLATSFTEDGLIKTRQGSISSINGAYASHGHSIAGKCGDTFAIQYNEEAISFEATTYYNTLPVAGAMRAYGGPQISFALECHIDDIALKLNCDPLTLRLKNLKPQGFYNNITRLTDYSNSLRECIHKGHDLIKWHERKLYTKNQSGSIRRGIGMAIFHYPAATYPHGLELASARISLNQDGSIVLALSATEIGQGSDTALAQIAAEELGITIDNIYVISEQDTDISPFDTGAYASRQTYVTGKAVYQTATLVKQKILTRASSLLGIPIENLNLKNNNITLLREDKVVLSLNDLALDSYYNLLTAEPIVAQSSYNTKISTISYGATFAYIEVDMAIGKVDILEIYNIHDSGQIINPLLAAGQVHGGMSMGIGYALYEELLFDSTTGYPLNNSLLDYKLMTAIDTPELSYQFIDSYDPTSSFGCKVLGEVPVLGPAPAIRNAILDATGVQVNTLPFTPERLIKAFKEANYV